MIKSRARIHTIQILNPSPMKKSGGEGQAKEKYLVEKEQGWI